MALTFQSRINCGLEHSVLSNRMKNKAGLLKHTTFCYRPPDRIQLLVSLIHILYFHFLWPWQRFYSPSLIPDITRYSQYHTSHMDKRVMLIYKSALWLQNIREKLAMFYSEWVLSKKRQSFLHADLISCRQNKSIIELSLGLYINFGDTSMQTPDHIVVSPPFAVIITYTRSKKAFH